MTFKGLTKSGYITKIKIKLEVVHNQQLYHAQSFKIEQKNLNLTKIFWFNIGGWYFQNPTEIMMS